MPKEIKFQGKFQANTKSIAMLTELHAFSVSQELETWGFLWRGMHNMLDHDTEELEQITPYVLSRPEILRQLNLKQDDPDGYLSACYPVLIPPFLHNLFSPSFYCSISNEM